MTDETGLDDGRRGFFPSILRETFADAVTVVFEHIDNAVHTPRFRPIREGGPG